MPITKKSQGNFEEKHGWKAYTTKRQFLRYSDRDGIVFGTSINK